MELFNIQIKIFHIMNGILVLMDIFYNIQSKIKKKKVILMKLRLLLISNKNRVTRVINNNKK